MSLHRHRTSFLGGAALVALAGCADTGARPETAVAPIPGLPAGVSLIGLGGGELAGVMGEPALVRAEGPAEYRRYGLAGCQLDLFLFTDPAGGVPRVVYLDARPPVGAPPASAANCGRLAAQLRPSPLPPPVVSEPL